MQNGLHSMMLLAQDPRVAEEPDVDAGILLLSTVHFLQAPQTHVEPEHACHFERQRYQRGHLEYR